MSLLSLIQISKAYKMEDKRFPVLKNISLNVAEGELLAILGPSGSGKSTLMNIIGLLDHADEGRYLLNNMDTATLKSDERATLRNNTIGFIFQQFNLLPRFTARQNVALPLTYRELTPTHVAQKVKEKLAKVGMIAYEGHRPTQLSGGQQQRIAIARALVGEPKVILADEPTGALDSKTGKEVMEIFLTLHAEGRTIIIITHDEKVAAQCQRRIILADGQIVA